MEQIKKNDVIELDITGITSEGSGVGHFGGMAVFVSGAAPGDKLECVIIKAKKNYAIGKIQNILTPSENRTRSDCRAFPKCGGCVFRHIKYEAELKYKEQRVIDAFKRIGHIDTVFEPIAGSESHNHYRNKAQYAVGMLNGRLLTGFYAPFSHRVINCPDCLLQPKEFEGILNVISRWAEKYKISAYNEKTRSGLLRHIYIRKGFGTGEIMVCLVINGEKIFKREQLINALLNENSNIKTVLLNHNTADTNVIMGAENTVLFGNGCIEDILCGKRFKLSPLSFYQVNHDQAEKLYEKAAELALEGGAKTVVDLYCGTGTIGLTFADKIEKLIGVEIVPDAVNDAEYNAKLNGINNAQFICSDAAKAAETLKEQGIKPDVVILDPPRKGCDQKLLETVAEMAPERIVYVSCDPATLARDCAVLQDLGYKAVIAKPFDMFPGTAHVETVVLLSQRRPDTHIDITLDLSELDITAAETKATYQKIKDYVFEKFGLKVSSLYISQVKTKCGIIERENYNKGREGHRVLQCPKEKEDAIMDALRHFKMV